MVSSYHFVPYESGDIYKTSLPDINTPLIEDRIAFDHTWSMLDKHNEVIACGGFVKLWEGCYELWYNPPQVLKIHTIPIIKRAKLITDALYSLKYVKRIQTQLAESLPGRAHLMKILGLKEEGTLHQFLGGEDYVMYARWKPCQWQH